MKNLEPIGNECSQRLRFTTCFLPFFECLWINRKPIELYLKECFNWNNCEEIRKHLKVALESIIKGEYKVEKVSSKAVTLMTKFFINCLKRDYSKFKMEVRDVLDKIEDIDITEDQMRAILGSLVKFLENLD